MLSNSQWLSFQWFYLQKQTSQSCPMNAPLMQLTGRVQPMTRIPKGLKWVRDLESQFLDINPRRRSQEKLHHSKTIHAIESEYKFSTNLHSSISCFYDGTSICSSSLNLKLLSLTKCENNKQNSKSDVSSWWHLRDLSQIFWNCKKDFF